MDTFIFKKKKTPLFEQKNIKLWNKWHFVESKTDFAAYLKNEVIFLLPQHINLIFRGVFLHAFVYVNTGL